MADCYCHTPTFDVLGRCVTCRASNPVYARVVREAADKVIGPYLSQENQYQTVRDDWKMDAEVRQAVWKAVAERCKEAPCTTVEELVSFCNASAPPAVQAWKRRRVPLLQRYAAPAARAVVSRHFWWESWENTAFHLGDAKCSDCQHRGCWPPPGLVARMEQFVVGQLDGYCGDLQEEVLHAVALKAADSFLHDWISAGNRLPGEDSGEVGVRPPHDVLRRAGRRDPVSEDPPSAAAAEEESPTSTSYWIEEDRED